MPNDAIWFKPAQSGKIRFVMFADAPDQDFILFKVERPVAEDATDSFTIDMTDYVENNWSTNIPATVLISARIPAYVFFYYEYEVPEEDISAGNVEYILMRQGGGSGGAYFVYLDIGANGTENDDDTGEAVADSSVTAVDFIYDGVSIAQSDILAADGSVLLAAGNFIKNNALYQATKTSVYFEAYQDLLVLAYARTVAASGDNETVAFSVAVYPADNADRVGATVANRVTITADGADVTLP